MAESRIHQAEEKLRKEQLKETRDRKLATLIGKQLSCWYADIID